MPLFTSSLMATYTDSAVQISLSSPPSNTSSFSEIKFEATEHRSVYCLSFSPHSPQLDLVKFPLDSQLIQHGKCSIRSHDRQSPPATGPSRPIIAQAIPFTGCRDSWCNRTGHPETRCRLAPQPVSISGRDTSMD